MNNQSDDKIETLLKFLSNDSVGTRVNALYPRSFEVYGSIISIDDSEFRSKDVQIVTVDFGKKNVSWFAEDINRHNGSGFGEVNGTAPWEVVRNSYDRIYLLSCDKAIKDATKAAREVIKNAGKATVDNLLKAL